VLLNTIKIIQQYQVLVAFATARALNAAGLNFAHFPSARLAQNGRDQTVPALPNKRKLTALTVTRLRPSARSYLVWDTYQRGLALLIQPSGYRAYKLIYQHRRRTRWYTIGAADAIALADARRMAAELMLEVIRGKDPAAEKRAEHGASTFAELHGKYLDQHAKKRNRSWKHTDALIKRHVLSRWGALQADAITRADVKALMRNMEEAPIAANKTLASVSAIYSWAVKEEILATNPCKLVARNPTRSRERILSASGIPIVWAAFDEMGMIGTALKLILLLGQRPGEVAHMRYEHLKDGWWEMPGEPIAEIEGRPSFWPGTKNGASHRVWLSKPAKVLIAELVRDLTHSDSGYVLTSTRGHVRDLDGAMRTICLKLGIERATPHDLRRTFGSTVTALGFGRDAMDRVLNHRSKSISTVYDRHGYGAEDQRIMESVASQMMELVQGATTGNVVVRAFTSGR
jgi:integrase